MCVCVCAPKLASYPDSFVSLLVQLSRIQRYMSRILDGYALYLLERHPDELDSIKWKPACLKLLQLVAKGKVVDPADAKGAKEESSESPHPHLLEFLELLRRETDIFDEPHFLDIQGFSSGGNTLK